MKIVIYVFFFLLCIIFEFVKVKIFIVEGCGVFEVIVKVNVYRLLSE